MKKKISKFLILFSCIFVLTGCSSEQDKITAQKNAMQAAEEYQREHANEDAVDSAVKGDAIASDSTSNSSDSKGTDDEFSQEETTNKAKKDKLVYTYDVNYTVDGVYKVQAVKNIDDLIEKTDCYVADSYQSDSEYQLTVRIANDKKDTFVKDMLKGIQYDSYSLNKKVDNKTDEYYDLQKSYDIAEENYNAYSRILEKADNVNDIVTITNNMNEAKGQMDYYKGLMNGIDEEVTYSTLNIRVRFDNNNSAINASTPFGWKVGSAFQEGFNNFVDFIKNIILWVVGNIFGILIFAIVVFVIVKYKKKHPVKEDKRYSYQDKAKDKKDKDEEIIDFSDTEEKDIK